MTHLENITDWQIKRWELEKKEERKNKNLKKK